MRFDLILMDLQMPVLDGLDATVAIRRFEKSRLLPAVPVLAYSSAFPGAGVLAAHGMSGSLVKPCEDRDLEDCLVRWCPGYLAGATVRGDPYDQHSWQAAKRSSGARGASLR
jgi:CheY-like chemotaxis protein